jgi:tRNA-2-methylthio-N6-dimethylallyladenosine synthase
MKFFIETYGCQMNMSDSFELRTLLQSSGLNYTDNEEDADVIIINTCSVRNTAEERVFGRLGYLKGLKKRKPNLRIFVTGCMAQNWGERLLKESQHISGVFGTYSRSKMLEAIMSGQNQVVDIRMDRYEFLPSTIDYVYPFKASVTIIHGCNHACTYCIVPKTRGKEVSRPMKDIIDDIKRLVDNGVVEVLLLGQNVNSYGRDIGTSFKELLKEVNKIEGLRRIRFLTSHPVNFRRDLIDTISELDKVCRYFHLPVQSGSNRILKLMKRGYTYEYYVDIINYIRSRMPDAAISTDIIVGFPSETEEDFKMTLKLVEEVRFDFSYMFVFNPRKGTPAASMPEQVPEEIKTERIQRLINLQHSISRESNLKDVGKTFEILVEDVGKYENQYIGRTTYNKIVAVESKENLIGKFVSVRIKELNGSTLIGEIINS